MAPTICDDEFELNIYRHRHHRPYSVISYVGRSAAKQSPPLIRTHATCRINPTPESYKQRNEISNEHRDNNLNCSRKRKLKDNVNQASDDIVYDLSKRPKTSMLYSQSERQICLAPIEESLPPASPVLMAASAPTPTCTDKMLLLHRLTLPPPAHSSHAQQRTLVEIAFKTIELLKRNRLLHERLERLQMETRQFVNSVMSNPENASLKQANAPAHKLAIESAKVIS